VGGFSFWALWSRIIAATAHTADSDILVATAILMNSRRPRLAAVEHGLQGVEPFSCCSPLLRYFLLSISPRF
jgi:hypothetical protein